MAMVIAVIVIIAGIVLAVIGSALFRSDSLLAEYRDHPVRYPLVAMLTGGLFITVYFGAMPIPGAVLYPGLILALLAGVCLAAGLNGGYLLGVTATFIVLALLHTTIGNSFLTETSAVYALLTLGAALLCRLVYSLRTPENAGTA